MFRCSTCQASTQPGERAHFVVTASRPQTYKDKDGNFAGEGFEIVTETKVCTLCATGVAYVPKDQGDPPSESVIKDAILRGAA